MEIRVTPTGQIITIGGLPSCVCCEGCLEQTTICVLFNDYGIGPQNITLTGSLNGGSFAGIYDPFGAAYPIALIWDGAAWGFWYNGVPLITILPDQIATISGETERCNPVGAIIYYSDAMIIVEAEVLSFGQCDDMVIEYDWSGTGMSDLDTSTIAFGENVGYSCGNGVLYLNWISGDNTDLDGLETVNASVNKAFADGLWTSSYNIECYAGWFTPAGGSGNALLRVTYRGFTKTKTISPSSQSSCASSSVATITVYFALQGDGSYFEII